MPRHPVHQRHPLCILQCTSSYTRGPTSSRHSSTRDSCFGHRTGARDYCSSVRGSTSCCCTCQHGNRCVPLSNFPCSTSWLFKLLPASIHVTSTFSAPTATSTLKASTSGIALPISIPLPGHPGGRSEFLTDAIQAGKLGRPG